MKHVAQHPRVHQPLYPTAAIMTATTGDYPSMEVIEQHRDDNHQEESRSYPPHDAPSPRYESTAAAPPPPPQHQPQQFAMDEATADRILATLWQKDKSITELQRHNDVLLLEKKQLEGRLKGLQEEKRTLLLQVELAVGDASHHQDVSVHRDQLQQELRNAKESNEELRAALALQVAALSEQVERSEAAERMTQRQQEKITSLEKELATAKQQLRTAVQELERSAEEFARASSTMAEETRAQYEVKQRLEERIAELESECVDRRVLATRLEFQETSLSELQGTKEQAERQQLQLAALQQQVAELQKLVETQQEALNMKDRHVSDASNVAQKLLEESSRVHDENTTYRQQLQKYEAAVHMLKEDLADAQERLSAQQDSIVPELEQRVLQLTAERAQLLHDKEDTAQSYAVALSEVEERLQEAEARASQQSASLAARDTQEHSLLEERSHLSEHVDELERRFADLLRTYQQERGTCQRLQQEREELEQTIQRLHEHHAQEMKDVQALHLSISDGQSARIRDLSQSYEEVVAEMVQAQDAVQVLQERCQQQERLVVMREQEVAHLQGQFLQETNRVKRLLVVEEAKKVSDQRVEELTLALEQLHAEHQKVTATHEKLQYRYQILKDKSNVQSEAVDRAREEVKEVQQVKQHVVELQGKVKVLETQVAAKAESLRSALDERSTHLVAMEELRKSLETARQQQQDLQRQGDAKVRAATLLAHQQLSQEQATHREVRDQLQKVHQEIADRVRHVAKELAEALGDLFTKCADMGAQRRKKFRSVQRVVTKVLEACTQDTQRVEDSYRMLLQEQGHASEKQMRALVARLNQLRWASGQVVRVVSERDALIDELQQTKARLDRTTQLLHEARQQRTDTKQQSTVTLVAPSSSSTTATHNTLLQSLEVNVSQDVRQVCQHISTEWLGLSGGFDELVDLANASLQLTKDKGGAEAVTTTTTTERHVKMSSTQAFGVDRTVNENHHHDVALRSPSLRLLEEAIKLIEQEQQEGDAVVAAPEPPFHGQAWAAGPQSEGTHKANPSPSIRHGSSDGGSGGSANASRNDVLDELGVLLAATSVPPAAAPSKSRGKQPPPSSAAAAAAWADISRLTEELSQERSEEDPSAPRDPPHRRHEDGEESHSSLSSVHSERTTATAIGKRYVPHLQPLLVQVLLHALLSRSMPNSEHPPPPSSGSPDTTQNKNTQEEEISTKILRTALFRGVSRNSSDTTGNGKETAGGASMMVMTTGSVKALLEVIIAEAWQFVS